MKRFLVFLVVVAGLVVGASLLMTAGAASVNGQDVTQQSLESDLSAIAGSTGFQCYLQAQLTLSGQSVSTQGLFPVAGAGSSSSTAETYNTTFARYWLSQRLSDDLVSQAVADRHLTVTAADQAVGRVTLSREITSVLARYQQATGASCGTTASGLLASLPATFRAELVQAQTDQAVLLAHEAGYGLGTASLHRYYTAHRTRFTTICVSYVSFDSKTAAAAAQASIAAGTPITQTGTEVPLGCAMRATITSLPTSVTSLGVGQVSAPFPEGTATGRYALLTVTKRTATGYASARTAVEAALLSAGARRTNALLTVANRRAVVTADPRYGLVRPHTVALAAPLSPPSTTLLDPTANLPAPASASPSPSAGSSTPPASG